MNNDGDYNRVNLYNNNNYNNYHWTEVVVRLGLCQWKPVVRMKIMMMRMMRVMMIMLMMLVESFNPSTVNSRSIDLNQCIENTHAIAVSFPFPILFRENREK